MTDTELVTIPADTALAVFTTENAIAPYLGRVRKEIDAFVADVASARGRKEVASMARKVVTVKTYLDGVGKDLADEQKAIPKKIDASRKVIRDTLDAWRDEVRKPLTDWEDAEDARVAAHQASIAEIIALANSPDSNSTVLKLALDEVEEVVIGPHCEEFELDYARAKDQTLTILKGQIAQREKYEREQIELAALRKATEERAASDRDEQIARDAAEKARAEVEANARAAADHAAAVSKAAADAAEQRERELKQAAKDAEQHAQAEREAAAQREADAQRQIEDANRRAAETEARIKREAEEAMALEAAETARREADREHRATINRTAVAALVEGGLTEDCARMAIAAIARGQVPNVSVRY